MIVSPILLCLCVVIFLVTTILDKLNKKWRELPHFVQQYVGGVLGICSVTDYHNTPPSKFCPVGTGEVYYFRKVPGTLVFANNTDEIFSGQIEWYRGKPYPAAPYLLGNAREVHDMLVPFASEKFFDFAYQKGFFTRPKDVEEYLRMKMEQNRRADRRLKFVAWHAKHDETIGVLKIFSAVFGLLMLLIVGGIALDMNDRATAQQKVTLHFTQQNGVTHTIETTNAGAHNELAYYDDHANLSLIKGRVSRTLEIGGGNIIACLERKEGDPVCGTANLSFKIGEEAFVRSGYIMIRFGKNPDHTRGWWVITKQDAEALLSTGKFKIVD
jgi:hypothetical protein